MMRRTRARAFTLIEVVVAAVLTGALLVLALRWVGALGQLAGSPSGSDTARVVHLAGVQYQRDFEMAMSCDIQRRDVAIITISPLALAVQTDTDNDGTVERVTWELIGDQLQRRVAPSTGGCTFGADGPANVVVDNVRAGTTEIFIPVLDGTPQPLAVPVDCTASWSLCAWDAVGLRLVIEGDGGRPAVLDVVALLDSDTRHPA